MHLKTFNFISLIFILLFTWTSCRSGGTGKETAGGQEYLQTAPPEEKGIASEDLARMVTKIKEEQKKIDSFLLIRDSRIVAEGYFNGSSSEQKHQVFSVTKSVISILIGKALEDGYLQSVDQKVIDFFPGYNIKNLDESKKALTIENLLTMRSGFAWDEFGQVTGKSSFEQMSASPDWIGHILDLPMYTDPGSTFNYCSANTHLLSGIIEKSTGMTTFEYAQKNLFDPLEISNVTWDREPSGLYIGPIGLSMTTRDMAKIGQLFLHDGIFAGKTVVRNDWITESTKEHTSFMGWGYGYKWWLIPGTEYKVYSAVGYLGQFVTVIPELNMTIVFTANLAPEEYLQYISGLITGYIVEAVKSGKPLPENREAAEKLKALLESF